MIFVYEGSNKERKVFAKWDGVRENEQMNGRYRSSKMVVKGT